MRLTRIIIAVLVFLFATQSFASIPPRQSQLQIKALITEMLYRESNYKHDHVVGDGGLAYGIAQFHRATFYYYAKKFGLAKAHWKNRADQLRLINLMVPAGYGKEWSVYRNAYKLIFGAAPPKKGVPLVEV